MGRPAQVSPDKSVPSSASPLLQPWFPLLQMVGRAGRPQFDTEGVAVIMTQRDTEHRYQNLLNGAELVESGLKVRGWRCWGGGSYHGNKVATAPVVSEAMAKLDQSST